MQGWFWRICGGDFSSAQFKTVSGRTFRLPERCVRRKKVRQYAVTQPWLTSLTQPRRVSARSRLLPLLLKAQNVGLKIRFEYFVSFAIGALCQQLKWKVKKNCSKNFGPSLIRLWEKSFSGTFLRIPTSEFNFVKKSRGSSSAGTTDGRSLIVFVAFFPKFNEKSQRKAED